MRTNIVASRVSITPSDSVNIAAPCHGVVATGAGNVVLVFPDDTTITLALTLNVPVTGYLFKRINATSTTATGISGLRYGE